MANNDRSTSHVEKSNPNPPPIPMVVPVRNNCGNISVPYDNGKTGAERVMIGDLQLTAGPNMVPLDVWTAAMRNPSLPALMKARIPRSKAPELEGRGGKLRVEAGAPVPAAAPLSALDVSSAIDLVNDVVDINLLRQLQAVESRAPVRTAIEARIVAVNDPSKSMDAARARAGENADRAQITVE